MNNSELRESGCGLSVGSKRGRLTVAGAQWRERRYWKCVANCECGNTGIYLTQNIGKTTFSCGCLTKELQAERWRKGMLTRIKNGTVRPVAGRHKVCERCLMVFHVRAGRDNNYCSRKCRWPNAQNGVKRWHTCGQCGEQFNNPRPQAKFCTVSCHNAYQTTAERRDNVCEYCSVTFTAKADHGEWPRYCDRKCFLSDVRSMEWDRRPLMKCLGGGRRKGEHRLLIESRLGRELEYEGEPVYHINGNKRDNRLSNMFLFPSYEIMGHAFQNSELPTESNLMELGE